MMARTATSSTTSLARRRSRGQVLVIFALTIFVFIGMCAVVVDVAWYWANNLRIQRAADAAALAGAVHLPGDVPTAITVARAEATKNGYTSGVDGYNVTPSQDPSNPRRLRVAISGPVGTFFAHALGINAFSAARTSKAEFILPVPMGSPEAYYGTFGLVRHPGGGITTPGNTSWFDPTTAPGTANWTNPSYAFVEDETPTQLYATKTDSTVSSTQQYGSFGISIPAGATITGIEISTYAYSNDSGCALRYEVSRNAGSSWSAVGSGSQVVLTATEAQYTSPPSGGSSYLWGLSSWTSSHLSDANFRVRIQAYDPGSNCTGSTATWYVDHLHVRVHYTTFAPDANITDPYGGAVNVRGFWGTMHNPGSSDIDGDAYLPRWETIGSTANDQYDPIRYYDYAVELGSGTSNGEVWVYDPVFCATDTEGKYGTGDRYFGGSSGWAPASAYYQLYGTNNTPYDLTDDTLVASSGTLFTGIQARDATMFDAGDTIPTGSDCSVGATSNQSDGRYWHLRWWRLASGLAGGTTYRLRTTTDDATYNSVTGHNSFALWSRASGAGTVKIYGTGAMEAFTPLSDNTTSTFYLAQIDAVHAGKTIEIRLWDPGDTGTLPAWISILQPTSGGYVQSNLIWSSAWGTTNSNRASCNGTSGSGTEIQTNTGGTKVFNGCWLTIDIPIPATYTAADPAGVGPGWWRIQYRMTGPSGDNSFDLTTWEVAIKGNPVHLVVP
jgi:hypothetical protein